MLPPLPRSWLASLVSLRGSLSHGVLPRLLFFTLIALGIWLANRSGYPLHLPIGLHEIAGAIIGLILAFRTNTAYARFWEGRILWGGVVNACRNLQRVLHRHARLDPEELKEISQWIVVFAHSMRGWLRGENGRPEIRRLLSEDDWIEFCEAPHPPLFVANHLSSFILKLVKEERLNPLMQEHAERLVGTLIDLLGGCERIKKTPTPAGYVLLLERCIAFFLATLPLALVKEQGGLAVIVTTMASYLVLMIEGLGRELDDPFGHEPNDLPLSRICVTIEQNLLGSSPAALIWAPDQPDEDCTD